jgi:hypothetical protein
VIRSPVTVDAAAEKVAGTHGPYQLGIEQRESSFTAVTGLKGS